MAKFICCAVLGVWKKKSKVEEESPDSVDCGKDVLGTLQVKQEDPVKSSEYDELNSTSFSFSSKVKVVSDEKALGSEAAAQAAYEGEDEHDQSLSINRNFSDFDDLQATHESEREEQVQMDYQSERERDVDLGVELIQSGHVSDPGIGKADFWASPGLQRSCSNLETSSDVLKKMADGMPSSKYHSFRNLQNLTSRRREGGATDAQGIQGNSSPESVMTPRSADRVMLKKHSSSQVLPSRSRRLWWKLFLWSHRNLDKSRSLKTWSSFSTFHTSNQKGGGYSSDTLEPIQAKELGKMESHGSITGDESRNNSKSWNNFHTGASGLWPQNQWVAFPAESSSSSMTRVDEWVNSTLETQPPTLPINDEDNKADEDTTAFPPSPDASPAMNHWSNNVSEEVLHAKNVIQSLNSSSTVAHISGMGLKLIPPVSGFSSLRSINLSGNFIVQITLASLPKGLRTLNLSRNKIVAIEGLRDLTRLRVLDLSYNRIARIGQGLSYCTNIKELYLAGNKISDVEGIHRLLKLTVLDLSFNKIATAKALGQLVGNYHSLVALNLLGNPIQSNNGEDQLRKTVSGILPQIAYLNKQPIKSQGAKEVTFAVGINDWTSHKKPHKRGGPVGSSSSTRSRSRVAGTGQKTSHRSKRTHHHFPTRQ